MGNMFLFVTKEWKVLLDTVNGIETVY